MKNLGEKFARWRIGSPWLGLKLVVGFVYLFMLVPILITASVSFNEKNRSKFPPEGFSLQWWEEAFSEEWVDPLLFSLRLATITAIISTAIGIPLAFGLTRYRFVGREFLITLTLGPLMLPTIVASVGLLQFFYLVGLGDYLGFWALLAGHVVICLPFTVRTVAIGLQALPTSVELAAASLGARPWVVLMEIVFPLIKSGIIAGAVFAFIHSFTDVNMSLFIAQPGELPITVKILGFLEFGFAPTLAAVSVITLIIPIVLVAVIERVSGLGDFIYGERENA